MDQSDKSYREGANDALNSVSEALEGLQDQIDCLRAEISVMTDDFVDLGDIAKEYGMSENDN